jgi:transposase
MGESIELRSIGVRQDLTNVTYVSRWTRKDSVRQKWRKSTHALSAELFTRHGIQVSDKTVAKLLREHGYSLQAPNKSVEGAQHPDRTHSGTTSSGRADAQ